MTWRLGFRSIFGPQKGGVVGHPIRHSLSPVIHNVALAEDVTQDALCRALSVWQFSGVPDDPAAWLLAVAKNRALDILRRDKNARRFAPDLVRKCLAQAPQNGARDPDGRVVEVDDLQERLQQIDLQVAPHPMRRFVGEDELELLVVELADESPRDENRRPPETADGRARRQDA